MTRGAQPPTVSSSSSSGRPPNAAEQEFHAGWQALAGDDLPAAVTHFERAVTADPSAALAEDASFWRAVALDRSGRTAEAERGLEAFVATYPASPRVEEASVALGWLHYAAGNLRDAKRRFEAAASGRSAAVRASARAGLDAIANAPTGR
jgi:TolA-binding protein